MTHPEYQLVDGAEGPTWHCRVCGESGQSESWEDADLEANVHHLMKHVEKPSDNAPRDLYRLYLWMLVSLLLVLLGVIADLRGWFV